MINEVFCIAKDCPLKNKCERAMKGSVRKYKGNTSFVPAPFKENCGRFECDMFVGDPADMLRQQLKSIIADRKSNRNN